jgi:hypothetical protein
LFWASLRTGELVTDGDLDARTAIQALTGAATQIGLSGEDGPRAVAATIRSGFRRAGAAQEPPDHPATDHPPDPGTGPAQPTGQTLSHGSGTREDPACQPRTAW